MDVIRKQLTLFILESNSDIEKIRAEFNLEQCKLIAPHVTLCREEEIEDIEGVIERVKSIKLEKPIQIEFKCVERFADGKGVLLPATNKNCDFWELRKLVLGKDQLLNEQFPHITLMHPRNSTCNDEIFENIKKQKLPAKLLFEKISLIEQKNGGKWAIIEEFDIVNKALRNSNIMS